MYKVIEIIPTKEEIIKLHKEMWQYIVDEEKKLGRSYPLTTESDIHYRLYLKDEWLELNHYSDVYNNCFLCEYGYDKDTCCGECPGKWTKPGFIACEASSDPNLKWTTADPAYIRDICD